MHSFTSPDYPVGAAHLRPATDKKFNPMFLEGKMKNSPSDCTTIRSFTIHVPDTTLDKIAERVRAFLWHVWSDAPDAEDWRYGPPATFTQALCEHWTQRYNWRAQETAMNALPHYTTTLDDMDIHFVHERGSGAAPVPLLIAHGWPYSFHSYDDLVDSLAQPASLFGLR